MKLEEYERIRSAVAAQGYAEEYEWAQNVKAPTDAIAFACQYIWVVLNSGMKNQIARKIHYKVILAIGSGVPVKDVFGHPGKAAAIQDMWDDRERYFDRFQKSVNVLAFCESLSWIGKITKWHLAKNLGEDVAKPDRWLIRVADMSEETPAGLCERLARESGDRIGTVDVVIWRACNLQILVPTPGE